MKRRPLLFTGFALVSLWSGWIVLFGRADGASVAVVPAAPRPSVRLPAVVPERMPAQPAATGAEAPDAPLPRLQAKAGENAFASRDWFRPPPPPPPPPPSPPPAPPPPPPPPPPPTLPYRFVGLMEDGPRAKPKVFLALGDKLLMAAVGDTLEGGYRLVAISAQELVFNHVQNNVTLKLNVAGGSAQ